MTQEKYIPQVGDAVLVKEEDGQSWKGVVDSFVTGRKYAMVKDVDDNSVYKGSRFASFISKLEKRDEEA